MLVLSRRQNETLVFPGLQTTIQVVSIKKGVVRLGVDAPEHVRVLRGELPDREAEWAETPEPVVTAAQPGSAPPLPLNDLVEKRLAILRRGLDEVQRSVSADRADETQLLLDKLDEDLHLLRTRLRREATNPQPSRLRCACLGGALECRCEADAPRVR
jgi:carbon storage regulator CsrA